MDEPGGALSRLLRHLGAADGPALALVVGARGTGRTHLLDQLVAHTDRRWRTVRVDASPTERELAFAGLTAVLHRTGHAVPAWQGACRELARRCAEVPAGDRLTVLLDVLELLGSLERVGRCLVVIDDGHHLDDATVATLRFVTARLAGDHLRIVVAVDPADRRWDGATDLLVPPDRLSAAQAAELVQRVRGVAPPPAVLSALLEHVDGAPARLLAVAEQLSDEELAGWRATPVPLPAIPGVRTRELTSLDEASREAVALVALSSTDGADVLRAALRHADLSFRDLQPAEDVGLVTLTDQRVRIVDPLLRSAAVAALPPARRRMLHAALGRALAELDPADLTARVRHRSGAAVVGGAELASDLLDLAAEAALRDDPAAAAAALAEAARHAERPPSRAALRIRAAEHAVTAGRPRWALWLLRAASHDADDDQQRLRIDRARAELETTTASPATAAQLLRDRGQELAGRDPELAAQLHTSAAAAVVLVGYLDDARADVDRARELAPDGGAAASQAALVGHLVDLLTGMAREAPDLDAHLATLTDDPDDDRTLLRSVAGLTALWSDRAEVAERILRGEVARLSASHRLGELALPLAVSAAAAHRRGWWDAAVRDAERAVELAERTEQAVPRGIAHCVLAAVAAGRGQASAVLHHAVAVREAAVEAGSEPLLAHLAVVRGSLDLALAHPERATVHLREARRTAATYGIREPAVLLADGHLLDALWRTGQDDALAQATAELEQAARTSGAAWTAAMALRGRALSREEPDADLLLERSATLLAETGHRFELARTLLLRGELALRRSSTVPDVDVAGARELFEELGAEPWIDRCDRVSADLGRERGAGPRLTGQERRIAAAAAAGRSNRAIAADLVLSPKTVEFHLRNAYRKLGVRGRDQLADVLAARSDAGAAPPAEDVGPGPD